MTLTAEVHPRDLLDHLAQAGRVPLLACLLFDLRVDGRHEAFLQLALVRA